MKVMLFLKLLIPVSVIAFTPRLNKAQHRNFGTLGLHGTEKASSAHFAAPARLEDNVEGVLYVNEKCIDCSACQYFAPSVFDHSSRHRKHVVKKQPNLHDKEEMERARAALSACPVAAIRVENSRQNDASFDENSKELGKNLAINPKLNGLEHPFPRPLTEDVWFVGHHNEASFGAVPYVVRGAKSGVSVLVDTPKFGPSAVRTVQTICGEDGPDYLFLSHVDDTADHGKWAERFPNMKRIFHEGDLGRNNWIGDTSLEDVEVLLKGKSPDLSSHQAINMKAWTLDGTEYNLSGSDEDDAEFVVVHTPGHSQGSISLLYRPNGDKTSQTTLFTGDTLAYSAKAGGLSGFGQYGNNMKMQYDTLLSLLDLSNVGFKWSVIAPGHGRYQKYDEAELETVRREEVTAAAEYLLRR